MILHKDEFPITIQAYDISGDREFFIAEQLVNNQTEIDNFSGKYAGKLIKAKAVAANTASNISSRKISKQSSGLTIFLIILVILIILIAIGFYTGWIQRTTGLNM